MIFHIHSDDFFLLSNTTKPTTHNAPIHIECKTLCQVVTSSAECGTSTVFHNAQTAIHTRYMLQQLGHSQPPTQLFLIIVLLKISSKIILHKRDLNSGI